MNKQKYIDLGRTINLYNTSAFRNPKTYVLGLIIPICISVLLEFLWAHYSFYNVYSPEMLSFMYVSIILGSFYIGFFSKSTRLSHFDERINIKINNSNLIKYSKVILLIEVSSINLLITTLVFYAISQANIAGFKVSMFKDMMAFVWVYYVIFGILLGLLCGFIFLTIASLQIKNIYSIVLTYGVLVFMLVFSDTVIPSKLVSNINAMNVIGYFNPIKYVTWSMNLISSYQFEDSLGNFQIYVARGTSFEPFNNLWETTIPAIVFTLLFIFTYGYKKEKN